MALESFPRGGKKVNVKKSVDLFDKRREQKKKHKTQTKKKNNNNAEDTFLLDVVYCLRKQDIQEEMTILGRVDVVKTDDIVVSLPGGSSGIVTPFDLSRSYSDGIKLISETNSDPTHLLEFQPISNLYNPGDYVVCYIKRKDSENNKISISLDPQLINQKVPSSFLAKGAKIVCTIMSVQENGYVIDTGLINVKGFLSSENIDDGKSYLPGNQLFCVVKEIKTTDHVSLVQMTARKKIIDKVSTYDTMFLDGITPGTKLSIRIVKRIKNGFQVAFGENNIGYVHDLYLDKDISKYENDMEVTGMLLYVIPIVKLAYFSLLINDRKEKFNYGDIINKAEVLQIREREGILVGLPSSDKSSVNRAFGLVPRYKIGVPFDKIPTTFAPGTTHKCRVIGYKRMEQLHLCSMEHLMLNAKLISDLKIGDVVKVQITDVDNVTNNVLVRTEFIRGFVPSEHVSDNQRLTNEVRKLVGKSVQARVLSIDSWTPRAKFTLKNSLIHSDLPVLCDISQAKSGSIYHGTVVKVKENHSIVRFYGDVRGFLPHTADSSNMYGHHNYRIFGQTVAVRVKSVDEKKKKMKLEFVPEEPEDVESCFSVGQQVEGTIIGRTIESEDMNGTLTVQLYNEKLQSQEIGFLPAGHLAPCFKLGYKLMCKYNIGDTIEAFVFATKPQLLLSCTHKPVPQKSFESYKVGDRILCSVYDTLENIVRVILHLEDYDRFGSVSKRDTSNFKMLKKHQVLFAGIKAINKRDKQFCLTMNSTEIWENMISNFDKLSESESLLDEYLSKMRELDELIGRQLDDYPLAKITLGQKVSGVVVSCNRDGIEINVCDGVKAFAKKEHSYRNYEKGQVVNGVVLWKDDYLRVSLLPEIINSISSKQDTLPPLPILKATLRAKILMITEWFVLVLVKRNSLGYLACLPVRRYLNHITPDLACYKVHAKVRVYCEQNRTKTCPLPICALKSKYEEEDLRLTSKIIASKSSCDAKGKSSKRKKPVSDENDVTHPKKMKKI